MEDNFLLNLSKANCDHQKQELYKQRGFDILNGLEFTLTRCHNCHKIMELEAKKLTKQ